MTNTHPRQITPLATDADRCVLNGGCTFYRLRPGFAGFRRGLQSGARPAPEGGIVFGIYAFQFSRCSDIAAFESVSYVKVSRKSRVASIAHFVDIVPLTPAFKLLLDIGFRHRDDGFRQIVLEIRKKEEIDTVEL